MDRHARPRCQPNAFCNKRCKAAKRAHGELSMRGAASDTPFPAMARFDFSVQLAGLSSPGRQPMLKVVDRFNRTREHVALRSMFEARQRFFVDELGWGLPVLAGLYESSEGRRVGKEGGRTG